MAKITVSWLDFERLSHIISIKSVPYIGGKMNYTVEQLARILIERSAISESVIKPSIREDNPDSIHNCKRVVELIKSLDAKTNIQNDELYELCLRFCEFYATEDISIQYVYDFAVQLTNKIVFSR